MEEPIDEETAEQLMKDLASIHVDAANQAMPQGYLSTAAQLPSSQPLRCFEFKHICGFPQLLGVSVH
jgi:hypothetical protein